MRFSSTVAHPGQIESAREERGAQDAAPLPSRLPGITQRGMGAQRAEYHDHQTGQHEQRDSGCGRAARRVEVALGQREHG